MDDANGLSHGQVAKIAFLGTKLVWKIHKST